MTFERAHKVLGHSGGRAHIATDRKRAGQKPALKMKEVMTICILLQMAEKICECALFTLRIDS
jgi:hypothetical protein